ncbi:hypothetical protein QQP08_016658, partial [Theobroma cacao]
GIQTRASSSKPTPPLVQRLGRKAGASRPRITAQPDRTSFPPSSTNWSNTQTPKQPSCFSPLSHRSSPTIFHARSDLSFQPAQLC